MLRGIGISNTIEQAADPTIETAEIRFDPLGGMTFVTGSISHGQGHATIQTQMLVDRLGVDPDRIKFIQGDTDAVAFGMGTGGSRSTTMSGGAIVMVSRQDHRQGQEARRAYPGGVRGRHRVQGRPLHHRRHRPRHGHPRGGEGGVPAGQAADRHGARPLRDRDLSRPQRQFPERLPRLRGRDRSRDRRDASSSATAVVDDVGTVINPMLVKGQIMGGIAQGMGQVLMEDKAYDETGQVLTGSFMDYAMPRAENFCAVVIEDNPVPTPTNPLGVKGAGEAGTVGSLSAGVNAIVDALSVLGIRHIDTPCTPYRVWQAIQAAKTKAKSTPFSPLSFYLFFSLPPSLISLCPSLLPPSTFLQRHVLRYSVRIRLRRYAAIFTYSKLPGRLSMPTFGGAIQDANLPGSLTGFISEAMNAPSLAEGSHSSLLFRPGRLVEQHAGRRGLDILELADVAVEGDMRQRQTEIHAGALDDLVEALDALGAIAV